MTKRISDLPRFLLLLLLFLPLKILSQSMADTTESEIDLTANFAPAPQDSFFDIEKNISARVNNGQATGIVVGIVEETGNRVFSYGALSKNGTPVDGSTLFEIGSITKVFTSLVLAQMVVQNRVQLDDPIAKYLPITVQAPTHHGKQILFKHLATHTSGLPRIPNNLNVKNWNDPYANYSELEMYRFLNNHHLQREIGEKFLYSNYGMGLLGRLLARLDHTSYEQLVIARICEALDMQDTRITLSEVQRARFAEGHSQAGKAAKSWTFAELEGAGALKSTANDLLKLLAANLGITVSPLAEAMRLTHAKQHRIRGGKEPTWIGLSWIISEIDEREIIWHNGQTGGYHSFIAFDKKSKIGVVVLSNAASSIDDIGWHLLFQKIRIKRAPFITHNRLSLETGVGENFQNHLTLGVRWFYSYNWGPADLLQIRPFAGYARFEIGEKTERESTKEDWLIDALEAGGFLDSGNLFQLFFPGTFLQNVAVRSGIKLNYFLSAERANQTPAREPSEAAKWSYQSGFTMGYRWGRLEMGWEQWGALHYFLKKAGQRTLGEDQKDQQQKFTLVYYF